MNKQELIKHFEEMEYVSISQMGKKSFIDLIEQLDGPQKVQVPQFVADWIEECKNDDFHLFGAMEAISLNQKKLDYWFREDDNMEIFARAWLDGYEVEEEKQYYVRFKFIEDSYSYLTLIKHLDAWTLHSITLDKKFRTKHTKKQLEEAGFGEVFNSTLFEVKEAEEW